MTLGPDLEHNRLMPLGFGTEEELLDYLSVESYTTANILGGIVFTSDFPGDGSLPQDISYKIR